MGFSKQWEYIGFGLLLILGALTCESMARTLQDASMHEKHEQWMTRYGREYKDAKEKEMRYRIFKENVIYIDSFNSVADKSYRLAVNQFADLTNEEFQMTKNRLRGHTSSAQVGNFRYQNVKAIPSTLDWRKKGAVTPIEDADPCGAAWAFSAVTAVEGLMKIKTGKLIPLSEQELIDCESEGGCRGGFADDAFEFIKKHGLASEAVYPHNPASNGTCNTTAMAKPAAKITGYVHVPADDEAALLNAVANQPVAVAIDASGSAFQFYSGGIFTGPCGTELDHGVAIVGYGFTNGTKYWLVKNSWGKQWGEKGYIRMQRDIAAKEGLCGIAMQAIYPTA